MEKITWKRKLNYIVTEAVILSCWAWSMKYGDENYAYNLYVFWIVIQFITALFILFSDNCTKAAKEMDHTFGPVVNYFLDGLQVISLAAVGWYWLAGCKLWSAIVSAHINELVKQDEEKEVKNAGTSEQS